MSKRIISLVLAVVLVFSMMGTGVLAATGTTSTASKYDASVLKMNSFGVILGYGNGDLGANDTITRAQFATAAIRALGYEDAAKAATGSTGFSDVSSNHWSAGYVNVATQLGIIRGMGNGTFAPDQAVTTIQALAMIERAMGYEILANEKGGWPTGYMVVANDKSLDLNLMKDITENPAAAAPRGLVCKILDNALNAPFYSIASYDSKGVAVYGKNSDVTLLVKMGYTQVKNVVVEQTPAYGADAGKAKLVNAATKAGEVEYNASSIQNLDGFMGQRVTAYYKLDNDNNKVLVELDTDSKSTVMPASQIKEMSVTTDGLKIKNSADVETTYDAVYENGDKVGALVNFTVASTTDDMATLIGTGASFGDQNDLREASVAMYDGKIDFIFGYKYEAARKVDSTVNNTVSGALKIKLDAGTYYINKDKDNKANRYSIIRDGAAATFENVAEKDIIYVASKKDATNADNAKDNMMKFFVTSSKISGELKSANMNGSNATKLKIGTTSYEMKTPATLASMDGGNGITFGDKITVTMTKDGKIFDVVKDTTSNTSGYAVVVNVGKNTDAYGVETYTLKLFKADGTKVAYVTDEDSQAEDTAIADFDTLKGMMVKYEINTDGQLVSLEEATSNSGLTVNVDNKTIDSNVTATDMVMFNVDLTNADTGKDLDANLVNWTQLSNRDDYTVAYKLNSDGDLVKAAMFEGVTGDSKYAVVTEIATTSSTEFNLTIMTKDGTSEHLTTAGIHDTVAALQAGDVVSFNLNGSGKIDTIEALTATNADAEEIVDLTDNNVKIDTHRYTFDKDGVMAYYNENLDNGNDFTSMTKAELEKYMTVKLYRNADGNVVVVAVSQK